MTSGIRLAQAVVVTVGFLSIVLASGIATSNSLRDYAGLVVGTDSASPQARSDAANSARLVPVLDGTLYRNKPDLTKRGFPPIKIVYPSELWAPRQDLQKLPSAFRLRMAVLKHKNDPQIVLDIEHWDLFEHGHTLSQENFNKYLTLLRQAKSLAPAAKIGFYGLPPISDYWRAIDAKPHHVKREWQQDNDAIQLLADAQDVLYPSLYTFYADQEGWLKYASSQISEARRLANGKPVFVFLWPHYHDSNKILGCRFLGEDYWRLQLEAASRLADGIIIWGGWNVCRKGGGPMVWDENAEWWLIAQEFLPLKSSSVGQR